MIFKRPLANHLFTVYFLFSFVVLMGSARNTIAQSSLEPIYLETVPASCNENSGYVQWAFPDTLQKVIYINEIGPYGLGGWGHVWKYGFHTPSKSLGLYPGIYKLMVTSPYSEETFQKVIKVLSTDSINNLPPYEIKMERPVCNSSGENKGFFEFKIDLTSFSDSLVFTPYIINDEGTIVYEEEVTGQKNGFVSVKSPLLNLGDYHIGLIEGDHLSKYGYGFCAYPIDSIFSLTGVDGTEFEIQETYGFKCGGSVKLIPHSQEELNYSLYNSEGDSISSGVVFEIDEADTYTIISEAESSCPTTKTFEVISEAWEAPLVEVSGDPCERDMTLTADIVLPEGVNADLQWFSEEDNDQPIGTGSEVTVTGNGTYFVKLHFPDSPECDVFSDPVKIENIPVIFETQLEASSMGFCNGVNSMVLTLHESNMPSDAAIFWYKNYFEENSLIQEGGKQLEIVSPGLYLAHVQVNGCQMTMDSIQVRELEERTVSIEEIYDLCEYEFTDLVIDLGDFSDYEWFIDGELISTEATFSPDSAGRYLVWLKDEYGCTYSKDFEVTEECEPMINYSTGIRPLNPKFPLVVYYNSFVQEVELYIFDKWGGVLFHAVPDHEGWNSKEGIWDGTINGKPVPNGNYNLLIKHSGKDEVSRALRGVVTIMD